MNSAALIYLDQNKWIEIARVVHGKTQEPHVLRLVAGLKNAIDNDRLRLPLSAIHYMEVARISSHARRGRLGRVMWQFSRGWTLAGNREIVLYEVQNALAEMIPGVPKPHFDLLGYGIQHAFGGKFSHKFTGTLEELFEESCLTGEGPNGKHMAGFRSDTHRENFLLHLRTLPDLKRDLPREKWDDALRAIALMDIREPLYAVMSSLGLGLSDIGDLERMRRFVDLQPSRKIDMHLHRQILKNPSLSLKVTDLEDWAGLALGCQYCDVVVCEKQFADLVLRDNFRPKAKVFRDIAALGDLLP